MAFLSDNTDRDDKDGTVLSSSTSVIDTSEVTGRVEEDEEEEEADEEDGERGECPFTGDLGKLVSSSSSLTE